MTDKDKPNLQRRLFLEKAGRFAAATPPAVALMLSATGAARAQVTSGGTTTATASTTAPAPSTPGP